eukprot:2784786-Pyramimonas_sp.AAC.1
MARKDIDQVLGDANATCSPGDLVSTTIRACTEHEKIRFTTATTGRGLRPVRPAEPTACQEILRQKPVP